MLHCSIAAVDFCVADCTLDLDSSRHITSHNFGVQSTNLGGQLCIYHKTRAVLSQGGPEILHVFVLLTPPLFHPNFGGVPVSPDHPCLGQLVHKP